MPSFANVKDIAARVLSDTHQQLFRLTNGRIGNTGFGMPVLMLATTGRKSGKVRTTMLTSPVQEGDSLVIVASYGGDNRHPAWFLNLRDNPDVEVTMRGSTRKMKARVASIDEKERVSASNRPRHPAGHPRANLAPLGRFSRGGSGRCRSLQAGLP